MRLKEVKKRVFVTAFALIVGLGLAACAKDNSGNDIDDDEPKGDAVIVATFNIGYDNPSAGVGKTWKDRRQSVANLIKRHKFDVFGAQEPLFNQLQDMEGLLPDYAYFGLSRDGKANSGEFAPIFYNKETVEILESGQFWLTDAEDKSTPSVGWDARYPRTCVWLKVKHKVVNETFFVFNVHLDHIGNQAQRESTLLLMEEIPQIAQGYPYFLLGDFNYGHNSANYQLLQSATNFVDTYGIANRKINGDKGTFPGNPSYGRIDHIFVNETNPPTIRRYQIVTDSFSGILPSDHSPVMVEVIF